VGPVVLRIKLRYPDVETLVERFARNIGKSGVFLPTKALQPVGAEVKFELRLANDVPVLVALGRVKHVRSPDPEDPHAAFGISLALMRVSREGRELIMKLLEQRRALGLPDVAIPSPDDIDEARRIEAELAASDGTPMPDAMSSGTPMPEGTPPPQVMLGSAPVAAPIAELAPEPQRSRPTIADVIARASAGATAASTPPELDHQVDVDRVLARARLLAGGDLDGELAALTESAAAPTEISVEAASAELARQLGGRAITKRDRSAQWTPPALVAVPVAMAEMAMAQLEPAAIAESPIEEVAPPVEVPRELPPELPASTIDETLPDMTLDQSLPEPELPASPTEGALPAIGDDTIDAAVSQLETRPSTPSLVPRESYVIRPSDRIDSPYGDFGQEPPLHLADHEEAQPDTEPPRTEPVPLEEDPELAAFDAAVDAARIHTGVTAPAPPSAEDEDDEIEEIDDDDVVEIDDVAAHHAEPQPHEDDFASRLDLPDDDEPARDPYVAPSYRGIQFRPHETGEEFDEPHAQTREPPRRRSAEDLESALSALDVDLDPTLRPPRRTPRPLPGLPLHRPSTGETPIVKKKRAETDDGVLIDFDDDD